MKCPSCGSVYPDGFQVCEKCGAYVSSVYQGQANGTKPKSARRFRTDERKIDPGSITASLKTAGPLIGGVALILMSLFTMVTCIAMYPRGPDDMANFLYLGSYSFITTIFKLSLVLSAISLVGGVAAIYRRFYAIATLGCVAAIIFGFLLYYLFGLFAALLVWGVIAGSQGEFRPTFPEDRVLLPEDSAE